MRTFTGVLIAGLMLAAGAQAEPPTMRAEPTIKRAPEVPPAPQPGPFPDRVLQAQAHYEALLAGRLFTSDLSPQELQDILDLERIASGAPTDDRSFQQRCIDEEVRRNGGNPTRLAWQVIRMKCK